LGALLAPLLLCMDNVGSVESLMNLWRKAIEFQAQARAQLDAWKASASRARHYRLPSSGSPFRARLNYAALNSFLTVLFFAASGATQAATIYPADPSYASVQTAVNSALDGDTVVIPAGTATWSSTLTITNGITLQGQTTTDVVNKTANDQTIILVGTGGTGNQPLINLNTVNGKSYRLSGITFRTGRTGNVNFNGMLQLNGNSTAVRVDHCDFDRIQYENELIAPSGPLGVIDHNLFYYTTNPAFALHFYNPKWNGDPGSWGDQSWAEPAYFGSSKFIFVEDNCFNNTSGVFRAAHDAFDGARFVFRHNHCYNMGNGSHGTESGRHRGVRACEIYNNDYHWGFVVAAVGGIRSGSFVTHDNTHDGVNPAGMSIGTFRVFDYGTGVTFGYSTGTNVWDYNATEPDGTHLDGHPPYLFESGTATGGSNTTIVDTTKNWTTNQWAGYTAMIPGGEEMVLISNNSNTLTGQGQAHTVLTWQAGSSYQIHKCLISMDQPGRGAGDLITGQTPINSTTGTASWPHQALDPCYSWNDIYTPTNTPLNIFTTNSTDSVLKAGRDYYNNTPMPGYTPYTYPHPLVTGVPSAPQNLRVSGP
jgi:hypothetical protein